MYGLLDNGLGEGLDFNRLPLDSFRFHRFFDSLLVLRQSGFARFNFDELDVDFAINVQAIEADEIDGAAQESQFLQAVHAFKRSRRNDFGNIPFENGSLAFL